ncbi:phosphatase PAP2 family protein [Pararhodospirillum oryzae]|uniref:Phosphoesterase n=1 Tax=Pararhodospirillum oryzae TaxID=478448 RepID=A0A512HAN6_9PROT|nr:phosphatase PAP2 family protein [Pararhodospirillum oryzae]GEO82517.1 phosphoesterase [Pararhodospirillum oryzae]
MRPVFRPECSSRPWSWLARALGPHSWPRRHPWRLLAGVLFVLAAVPGIDLGLAALFFDPGRGGFVPSGDPLARFVIKGVPLLVYGTLLYMALVLVAGRVLALEGTGRLARPLAYLVTSLLVGPGVLVNLVFKEHWGRARPRDLIAFGGDAVFTPVLLASNHCDSNCSFPSGHAALGFWTTALALLVSGPWRPWAVAGALVFGALVGLSRMSVGAHFFSDTLVSGVLVVSLNVVLYRWMIEGRRPGR